ncbi:hypothetical protein VI08_20315 [Luteibacter yeojuensis]|uniref:YXWGXW repeat-containing protein n=1 Tax=Luteibacter yeojuensis TaxID=345309 RepID=A0A0F3K3S0_9GAMM|nr:hypothetical protein VI08_20315 [Luteibacter yeojuensis]
MSVPMRWPLLCLTTLATGCAPVSSRTERVVVIEQSPRPTVIHVTQEPPREVVEVEPPPREGWLWAHGYWRWDGRDYVRMPGHWERVVVGRHYVHTYWERRDGQWWLHEGYWAAN